MDWSLLMYLLIIKYTNAAYFHEQSRINLEPSAKSAKGFGSSISFFNDTLLVGAPYADLNGAVFVCPLNIVASTKSIVCSDSGINLNDYANEYDRSLYPNQHFCLGSSIAATKSYFVTCAPLWAMALKLPKGKHLDGAFGTCFASTEYNHTKTNRLVEHYQKSLEYNHMDAPNYHDVYGTFGWSTLVDEVNKIVIFAKPASNQGLSRISYQPIGTSTGFPKLVQDMDKDLLMLYNYKGRALANGEFFKDYKSLIAFSMENDRRIGAVSFLSYNTTNDVLSIVKDPITEKALQFKEGSVGSMFGAALHAADLNHDAFSDLFVGAPGLACWVGSYEVGAVYIYLGGEKARSRTKANLYICGKEDGSRFGAAIASADLDDDDIPELFISAPYEGFGTVYVISGRDVKEQVLLKRENLFIKDLKTQEIKISDFQTFGFSLHVIPAIDRTQLNALAVGSPNSQRVTIYRSIPSITVTINVVGDMVVRESHDNFTIPVQVKITYPRAVNVTAKLTVKVSLASNMFAEIVGDAEYELDITAMKPHYLINFIVKMNDHDPHIYKIKAEVKTKEIKDVYDSSILRFSSYSKTEIVHDITRTCDDDVCRPRLSATFDWSGRNDSYILGSSKEETMTVNVVNDGNSSDVSCAYIKVTGAPVALLECDQPEDSWYRCNLKIERHERIRINITLNMKRPTSTDEKLVVEVLLYNDSPMSRGKSDYEAKTKVIPYILNPNDIVVSGSSRDEIITDSKLNNENSTINVHALFTITNEGSVLWKGVKAELVATGHGFIEHFKVFSSDFQECALSQNFTYHCNLDIKPNTDVRIGTTTQLIKNETVKQLSNDKLKTMTTLILTVSNRLESKEQILTTTLSYRKDKTFGQNQTSIIIVACVSAAIILAILIFGLYRMGFFKREEKKKLERLRSTIKRPAPSEPGTSDQRRESALPSDNEDCVLQERSAPIPKRPVTHRRSGIVSVSDL
ncbi:integrin alpha-8 isoform X2 [Pieris rapae]|uniref:integrin alpha-8 isoform X2 n=1 Tax=Pieris rapae TaxID=64459 RepID=UPI001E27BDD6|nr:integrin alpha-8 isoform X2 [Pieris rapae]